MARKPTYEELEQLIEELRNETLRRKSAEESLFITLTKYKTLFEAFPLGITVSDDAGKILEANSVAEILLGVPKDEHIRRQIDSPEWRIVRPDGTPMPPEEYASVRALKNKCRVENVEMGIVKPNGQIVWINVTAAPLPLQGHGVVIAYADITERRRAEKALQESEARYKNLYEEAPIAYMELDREGRVAKVNKRQLEILGYSAEEILGQPIWNFVEEEETRATVEAKLEGRRPTSKAFERLYRRKDGTKVPVLIADKIVKDNEGRIVGLRSTMEDITERKRAEEALRQSEEKFRNLVETTSDWIWEIDAKGHYSYVSPHVRHLLGYEPEELIGHKPFDFMPSDEVNRVMPEFARIRSERRPFFSLENVNLTKDGRRVSLETSGVPMLDPQGKLMGYRGVDRDITHRKLAEAEKQKLEAQLQQARKMEAVGTLAGGIAHDFNNILMGIQGRASLMLLDMDSSNPHFEHLRGIEEYVKSAADLTKQLLGFARGGKYEVKATNLNELADHSASLFGRTRKEISVHRKFHPGVWTVEVDRRQIEQVLLNLFVNAWQAMPAGGEIYLQTENVVLTEDYARPHGMKPGNYVRLSVTDTGMGMDEQTKQRLFDPFFTTKEMGRGTGLGLASAYGIIKNHEGMITVYSEKGHGSTFDLYLPASNKEVSVERQPPPDLLKGEGALLLVDDEEMILEVGKPMLEKLGYQVLTARSGKEAIRIYQNHKDRIVAVILDMIMPQMGGGETFDHLRAANPSVKVLLSSGYSMNGQAQEILNRGCRGFIQKPFNLRELSQRLVEITGKP